MTSSPSSTRRAGWRRWFWLFVLALLVSLIWSVPASVLPRLLSVMLPGQLSASAQVVPGEFIPPIMITRTRGRLWSGEAGQIVITPPAASSGGSLVLENVRWRVQWSSLLRGNICLDLASSGSPRTFAGNACVSPAGAVTVDDLVFEWPASDLVSRQLQGSAILQALSNAMQIEGQILGRIDALHWQARSLQTLQAEGEWSSAALVLAVADPRTGRIARQPLALGALPWRLETSSPGQFLLYLEPAGNSTDLRVSSQTRFWLDGRYETDVLVGVQPGTPPFLRDLLRLMAQETEPGVYRLSLRNI